ncbi:DUF4124 domain-containing protein [Bacterioplanes sanyensis]|nr:DUF4124 domain-containing protein [Bacterioplanes sanyensis]
MPAFAADSDYYTWVDEQGRVHNSPKPGFAVAPKPGAERGANSETQPGINQNDSATPEVNNGSSSSEFDPADFPDEAEVIRRQQQQLQQQPPFYIWVDERGVSHIQTFTVGEGTAPVVPEAATFDHILIPPFRWQHNASDCCERYLFAFKQALPADETQSFDAFDRAQPFLWQGQAYRGWYFQLLGTQALPRQLQLTRLGEGEPAALLLLNDDLQPLYWLPRLNGIVRPASWASDARYESLIEIRDPQVRFAVVLMAEQWRQQSWSMTARWSYGTTSP